MLPSLNWRLPSFRDNLTTPCSKECFWTCYVVMTIPTDLFRIAWSLNTVPGLRRSVAGLSAQGGAFDPARVHVIYMVKIGLCHSTSGFPCQSPFIHSSRPSSSSVIKGTKGRSLGTFKPSRRCTSTVALVFLVVKMVRWIRQHSQTTPAKFQLLPLWRVHLTRTVFYSSSPTLWNIHTVSIIKTNWLMPFCRKKGDIYRGNHMENKNISTLCVDNMQSTYYGKWYIYIPLCHCGPPYIYIYIYMYTPCIYICHFGPLYIYGGPQWHSG
jgi:hypothetical protein